MKGLLKRKLELWQIAVLLLIPLAFAACPGDQTTASRNNATTAADKWGPSPNITNYYEYEQQKEIYEARDNPKLVLNAYISSPVTGQLTCLGKVAGYGVPYGTQWSQPNTTTGSVPEPNGLYPSQNTSADWIRIIDKDGKQHLTFAEPDLIITDMDLPCKPLASG